MLLTNWLINQEVPQLPPQIQFARTAYRTQGNIYFLLIFLNKILGITKYMLEGAGASMTSLCVAPPKQLHESNNLEAL